MINRQEQTKKAVLDAVRERAQETRPVQFKIDKGPQVLGQYLQSCLKSHEMSRVTFALTLDMEIELTDAILDGILPASELHEDLLYELAEAADCDYNNLVRALNNDLELPAAGWSANSLV